MSKIIITKEQRDALTELFQEVSSMLDSEIYDIVGRNVDIVMSVHMHHGGDEECKGAIVLSNTSSLEQTGSVLAYALGAVSDEYDTQNIGGGEDGGEDGGEPSDTIH